MNSPLSKLSDEALGRMAELLEMTPAFLNRYVLLFPEFLERPHVKSAYLRALQHMSRSAQDKEVPPPEKKNDAPDAGLEAMHRDIKAAIERLKKDPVRKEALLAQIHSEMGKKVRRKPRAKDPIDMEKLAARYIRINELLEEQKNSAKD